MRSGTRAVVLLGTALHLASIPVHAMDVKVCEVLSHPREYLGQEFTFTGMFFFGVHNAYFLPTEKCDAKLEITAVGSMPRPTQGRDTVLVSVTGTIVIHRQIPEPMIGKPAEVIAFSVTRTQAVYVAVSYCDLMRNPRDFHGKRVAVAATYRYGFEWQELFCLACRSDRTWLEFPREPVQPIKFQKAPREQGTINATFYGTFVGQRGSYGDGGFQYRFDLDFIRNDRLVSKSGSDPNALPPEVRARVCQGKSDQFLVLCSADALRKAFAPKPK